MNDGVRVVQLVVACMDDSHADRPFEWTLTRQMGRRGAVWIDTDREAPSASPRRGHPRRAVVTLLDADDNVVRGLASTAGRGYRRRFQFKCGRCSANQSWRAERVEPVLDAIADSTSAVSVISLHDLAAKLAT